jgi:hypothetical protein
VRRFGHLEPLDPREPVQHVSFFEAEAFARWSGGRLPTEAEWEKAAAWDPAARRARTYPWGEAPPGPEHANLDQTAFGPAPVGSFPAGASAYGAEQLLGDVYEWTTSPFTGYPGYSTFPYPEYSEVFFDQGYHRRLGRARHLPQLGLPQAPADLRRAAAGLGPGLMCRMAAYAGPAAPLSRLLADPPWALEQQAWRATRGGSPGRTGGNLVNVDGTGVVWWPAGERRRPPLRYVTELPPWADPNLLGLAARLEGAMQLALVRSGARPAGACWSACPTTCMAS